MKNKKIVLIFGISGQDGSLLAEYLLKKSYKVIGISRKNSSIGFLNLKLLKIFGKIKLLKLNYSKKQIENLICYYKPNQIFNFSAQSSVYLSFKKTHETINKSTNLNLFILETLKKLKLNAFYFFPSSGEIFGNINTGLATENSKFDPTSPYAISKLSNYYLVKNFRESYNLNCASGILFNHESIFRTNNYVTMKIINTAINIKKNKSNKLKLDSLKIKRDWGWAPEYIEAIYKMSISSNPNDYIISTGKVNSLKDFVRITFELLDLDWKSYTEFYDKSLRPLDVYRSGGNPIKIKKDLGWNSRLTLEMIIKKIIDIKYQQ